MTPLEACLALKKIVVNNSNRLIYGLQDRNRIQEEIADGKRPKGPRVTWVQSSGEEIMELLADLSREYNKKNQEDRISTEDLKDVLRDAIDYLDNHDK